MAEDRTQGDMDMVQQGQPSKQFLQTLFPGKGDHILAQKLFQKEGEGGGSVTQKGRQVSKKDVFSDRTNKAATNKRKMVRMDTHACIHSLTHSVTHSVTHSLTHLL